MTSIALSLLQLITAPAALILITLNSQATLLYALILVTFITAVGFLNYFYLLKSTKSKNTAEAIHTVCTSIGQISVFLAFLQNGWMALWMVFLIYARDIIVPYLQSFSLQKGLNIRDNFLSTKVKIISHGLCQIGVIVLSLNQFGLTGRQTDSLIYTLLIFATGASVISFINYLVETVFTTRIDPKLNTK